MNFVSDVSFRNVVVCGVAPRGVNSPRGVR